MGEPALAAGWYPDPWQQGELRWHDGAEWTGHVHATQAQELATAVAVAAEPEQASEGPALVWAQEVPQQQQQQPTMQFEAEHLHVEPLAVFEQQAPEAASMAMPSMEETLAGERERGRESSKRLVLLGVMAVVAIAAVAFVILGRGEDAPATVMPAATEPAITDPAAPAEAAVAEPTTPTAPPSTPGTGLESAAQLAQEAPGAAAPTEPAAVPAPGTAPPTAEAPPAPAPTGEQIPELVAPAG